MTLTQEKLTLKTKILTNCVDLDSETFDLETNNQNVDLKPNFLKKIITLTLKKVTLKTNLPNRHLENPKMVTLKPRYLP